MKITGKIKFISPVQSGINQAGKQWQKQEFLVEELIENYPQSAYITAFNEKVSELATKRVGDIVSVEFDSRCREFNGRYYNDFKLFRFVVDAAPAAPAPAPAPQPQQAQPIAQQPMSQQYAGYQQPTMGAAPAAQQPMGSNDGLPF